MTTTTKIMRKMCLWRCRRRRFCRHFIFCLAAYRNDDDDDVVGETLWFDAKCF